MIRQRVDIRERKTTMKPIVVGIDGSQAAIRAALWGADEAISRSLPLRLVSVLKSTHLSSDDYDRDLQHAEISIREAQSAVEADARPVKIETDTPRGPAGPVLVEASHGAEMICVGSVGIGRYARSIVGSTATELAEKAHCPVAVLRTDSGLPPPDVNWIVVRMTDAPDNDAIVEYAAWEAKLHRAPMLVLGGRLEDLTEHADGQFERRIHDWRQRHPEVRVYPITTRQAIAGFLRANDERVQLAVIGGAEAGQLARLVGPSGHPLFHHPECSVLVVRG
jgi:nucleotide-binding universal stress UspA family protein